LYTTFSFLYSLVKAKVGIQFATSFISTPLAQDSFFTTCAILSLNILEDATVVDAVINIKRLSHILMLETVKNIITILIIPLSIVKKEKKYSFPNCCKLLILLFCKSEISTLSF